MHDLLPISGSVPTLMHPDSVVHMSIRHGSLGLLIANYILKKFASNACPCSVRMDSGWNCTPSSGANPGCAR